MSFFVILESLKGGNNSLYCRCKLSILEGVKTRSKRRWINTEVINRKPLEKTPTSVEKDQFRELLDKVGKELSVTRLEDWYKVRFSEFYQLKEGKVLLKQFSNSHIKVLQALHPEFKWRIWRFNHVPNGWWEDRKNHRLYLDELGEDLGYSHWEHWYQADLNKLRNPTRISYMLEYYDHYLPKALQVNYPEHPWRFWRFENIPLPDGYWKDKKIQRKFMESVAERHGIKEWKDWYEVSLATIHREGGRALLAMYDKHLINALKAIFPEYPWIDRPKAHADAFPKGHWKNKENHRQFFDELKQTLGIKQPEDWYSVKITDMQQLGGLGLLNSYYGGSLRKALAAVYPEQKWEEDLSIWRGLPSSKSQLKLFETIGSLFPNIEVYSDFMTSGLQYSESQLPIELDIYIPSLKLALEYQGAHHYKANVYFGSYEERKKLDDEKKKICERNEITLIQIPYWWDGMKESLQATIHQIRPDLLSPPADPKIKPIGTSPP